MLTLDRWIRDAARTTPARVAIDCRGVEVTYRELDERSDRLAAGLLDAGLVRGDRVATLTSTSPEHVVAFFACAKAGLILLPLNTRLAPPEVAYQLEDAEPAVLLHDEAHAETARGLHRRAAGLRSPARARVLARARLLRTRPRMKPLRFDSLKSWARSRAQASSKAGKAGWLILWLLGVPIPILLILFLVRGCT